MTGSRLLPRLPVCLALLGLAACGELEPPAVTIGESVLTVSDLRTVWADIPTPQRPPLSTREERLAFVDRVVQQRLLAAEGRRLLADRPAEFSIDFDAIETDILVRRLRVVASGDVVIDSTMIAEAEEKMTMTHLVEWVSYSTRAAAEEAARRIGSGGSFDDERDDPRAGGSAGERRVVWSPFSDPLGDVVSEVAVGAVVGPVPVGGEWLLIRVNGREPWEVAEGGGNVSTVARGLRIRTQNEALERLQADLWVRDGLEIDEDGIARLVARTTEAILRPGVTEHDPDWALPVLAPGEESAAVALSRGEVVYTAADYVAAVERRPGAQRPRGGNLAFEVRRLVEDEVGRGLLREEAVRRGLRDDWFTRRQIRSESDQRLVQLAIQSIEKRADPGEEELEALLGALRESRAEVFRRPARARVLRFDLPTRPAAIRELANLRRAGSALERLREILEGRGAPLAGTYHLTHMARNAVGVPAVDRALFEGGPGTLAGPFEVGNVWMIVHCLEVEPAYDLDEEEVGRELLASVGTDSGAVARWVQSRRLEARVAVDEDALDALGAAA